MSETPSSTEPARTPEGTLIDLSTTTPTPTPPIDPTKTESTEALASSTTEAKPGEPKPGETLLTKEEPKGAPEKYETFTVPEGIELKGEALEAAIAIFKDLKLDQASAQKLVDYHIAQIKAVDEAAVSGHNEMREKWQTDAKADPEIGPKIGKIKENLGRAFDSIQNPALVAEFKDAMNLTGVGDHPAFIKLLNKLAERAIEPKHVSATNPSPHSQANPAAPRTSAAAAMYPHLAK